MAPPLREELSCSPLLSLSLSLSLSIFLYLSLLLALSLLHRLVSARFRR
jgi:hypothetical protein